MPETVNPISSKGVGRLLKEGGNRFINEDPSGITIGSGEWFLLNNYHAFIGPIIELYNLDKDFGLKDYASGIGRKGVDVAYTIYFRQSISTLWKYKNCDGLNEEYNNVVEGGSQNYSIFEKWNDEVFSIICDDFLKFLVECDSLIREKKSTSRNAGDYKQGYAGFGLENQDGQFHSSTQVHNTTRSNFEWQAMFIDKAMRSEHVRINGEKIRDTMIRVVY